MNSKMNAKPVNIASLVPMAVMSVALGCAFVPLLDAGSTSVDADLGRALVDPTRSFDSFIRSDAAHVDVYDAQGLARWVAATGDAGRRPFVIVDKANARVMVFEASGELRSSSPALLGLARGDDSVPGIGTRPMDEIRPEERITPAGRFIARPGTNLSGEDIVWVDYDAAVSMHRVRATVASEQRLQRLASPGIDDNRISYGCINLPASFYDTVIHPMVQAATVVIYVLPETRPLNEVFALGRAAWKPGAQIPS